MYTSEWWLQDCNLQLIQTLLDQGKAALVEFHPDSKSISIYGKAVSSLFGRQEVPYRLSWSYFFNTLCHPQSRADLRRNIDNLLAEKVSFFAMQLQVWNNALGEWCLLFVYCWREYGGEQPCIVGGISSVHRLQEHPDFFDALEHLLGSENRVQIMLDECPISCNYWDDAFHIIDCNQESPRLFGLTSKHEYLSRFWELSPQMQPDGSDSRAVVMQNLKEALDTGWAQFEWMHCLPDGTPIPAEVTLVRTHSGVSKAVIAYTRDLRPQKAMLAEIESTQQQLRNARDEAELNAKIKSEFLANMSHEIRTPMNAVLGMTHLLLHTELTQQQRFYLEKVSQSAKTLLRIINDILDLSKLEAGHLEMEQVSFYLERVLLYLSDMTAQSVLDKKLDYSFYIDPLVPSDLIGDSGRLGQVLLNLVSNAVKFTASGGITVSVTLEEQDQDHAVLHFEVRDTGVGISPDKRDKLFQPFTQADSSITRTYGGTGLGLAICLDMVRLMDGAIWCDNAPGGGSSFQFTARFRLPQKVEYHLPGLAGLQVLLLGSNDQMLLLKLQLQILRCTVTDTLAQICPLEANLSPGDFQGTGLIVINCRHSAGDAPQVFGQLETVLPRDIPIVYTIDREDLAEMAELMPPSITVLARPFSIRSLYNAILEARGHVPETVEYPDDFFSSEQQASDMSSRLSGCRILLAEDNEVNQILMVELLTSVGCIVDVADNGRQALRLLEDQPDYQLVLMDIQMPEMDGFAAAQAIRQNPRWAGLPILALTAHAMAEEREAVLKAGMNDRITKPVDPALLYAALEYWIFPGKESSKDQATAV